MRRRRKSIRARAEGGAEGLPRRERWLAALGDQCRVTADHLAPMWPPRPISVPMHAAIHQLRDIDVLAESVRFAPYTYMDASLSHWRRKERVSHPLATTLHTYLEVHVYVYVHVYLHLHHE
jgi:hypothetical protein